MPTRTSVLRSVFERLGLSDRKTRKGIRATKRRAFSLEPLERRELLSVAPPSVWISNNWTDQTNPGATTPAVGNVVAAPAGETVPGLGSGTLTYGQNAFSTIQSGVNNVASGGTAYVLPGTYTESDISLNQAVSIVGPVASAGVADVVPAVADSHVADRNDWFGSGSHNAFVIRASDVSLSNLTINGGCCPFRNDER